MGLYEVPLSVSLLGFGIGTMLTMTTDYNKPTDLHQLQES